MYDREKLLLPEFPRTLHLPLEPNTSSGDKIASVEMATDFLSNTLVVEEKLDGANSGIAIFDGEPVVRNRSHILRKGYSARKTPAQQQFAPIWTWLYANADKIRLVERVCGRPVSIYGEWMFARHVKSYDNLPDWFIAYDVYDANAKSFLDPLLTNSLLQSAGFAVAPVLGIGIYTESELLSLRQGISKFSSTDGREGIYLKAGNGALGTGRYKMVNPDFQSDDNWNKKPLVKNKVVRPL